MQLRDLRDQSKLLESQLYGLQHGVACEERELHVLMTSIQQTSPEDSQYVCVVLTCDVFMYTSIVTIHDSTVSKVSLLGRT